MIGVLRVIRGFVGSLVVLLLFGLVPVLTWLQQPSAVTGYMYAQLLVKVIFLLLFGGLFLDSAASSISCT